MILIWWAPTVKLVSIRGLSPAGRGVVNNTGYKLLIHVYHLGLPLLREMCMVHYLFTYIHWTVVALYRSVATAHIITITWRQHREVRSTLHYGNGQINSLYKFWQKRSLDLSKNWMQTSRYNKTRAVARGVEAVCSNPPFGLQKILYTTYSYTVACSSHSWLP